MIKAQFNTRLSVAKIEKKNYKLSIWDCAREISASKAETNYELSILYSRLVCCKNASVVPRNRCSGLTRQHSSDFSERKCQHETFSTNTHRSTTKWSTWKKSWDLFSIVDWTTFNCWKERKTVNLKKKVLDGVTHGTLAPKGEQLNAYLALHCYSLINVW